MSAISGTRRQIRELVDGSLEVRIHVDPRFKADFHRLFPSIDMPCALAPLVPDFERIEDKQKGPGPLCRLAAIWCKDRDFLEWADWMAGGDIFTEEDAANWIRKTCEVESRRDLDNDQAAALRFQQFVREPFMDWLKSR